MNITWLSLRDLQYVVKVADFQNFGRAAIQSNVSQPALSMQIKKIEGFLGYQLFERNNRKVLVTEQGQQFVDRAKKILELAQTFEEVSNSSKPFDSAFRLGAIRTAGPYLMPWFLPHFFKSYKKGQILIREGLTEELIELLRKGDLDGVIASPTFDAANLTKQNLYFEPFRLLLPKAHTLAEKKHISTRDLDASSMVLLEDGHCLKDQSVEICASNKRGVTKNFHATSLETLKQLVAAGQGYTFIPELAVTKDRLETLVTYKIIEGKSVGRSICLYTRKESSRFKEAALLANTIRLSLPPQVQQVES